MTRINIPREPIDPGKIVRNPKVAAEWKRLWSSCWLCPYWRNSYAIHDVHHIVGGAHRSDEQCNFAFFCRDCHQRIETLDAESGIKVCLYLKKMHDPHSYDKSRIEALFGRRLDQ